MGVHTSADTLGRCASRGEAEIEKVFVLDAHGFIRQKEVPAPAQFFVSSIYVAMTVC